MSQFPNSAGPQPPGGQSSGNRGAQQPFQQYAGVPHPGGPHPGQPHPGQPHPGHPQPPLNQPPHPHPPRSTTHLADGAWHKLHPLTTVVTLIGTFVAVLWAMAFSIVPTLMAADTEVGMVIGISIVGTFAVVLLISLFVWLYVRSHAFRVDHEVFELKKGIVARSNRRIRLDRLQSVNINRPLGVRLLGLASFVIAGGGAEGTIKLSYIGRDEAEQLRTEVLRRAAGARREASPTQSGAFEAAVVAQHGSQTGSPGVASANVPVAGPATIPQTAPTHPTPPRPRTLGAHINGVLDDLSRYDDVNGAPEDATLIRIKPHLMGLATAMSVLMIMVLILAFTAIGFAIIAACSSEVREMFMYASEGGFLIFAGIAVVIGLLFNSLAAGVAAALGALSYTIAGTPDGIRITRGLANRVSDTVPPGRIHSVQVTQPLLWRIGGWYRVQVNRIDAQAVATSDSAESAQAMMRATPLPVGKIDDVQRLLTLLLPMNMNPQLSQLVVEGLKPGPRPGFAGVRAVAFWLHPFEWRRLGYAIHQGLVCIRNGRLNRNLVLVPSERIQTVSTKQSPIERMLGVAHVRCHTIHGPVHARIPCLPAAEADRLHLELTDLAVATATRDTSHRWEEARAFMMLNAARMEVADARSQGRAPHPHALQVLAAEQFWQQHVMHPAQAASPTPQQPGQQHPHPQNRPPQN